jgi:hypothetical protein
MAGAGGAESVEGPAAWFMASADRPVIRRLPGLTPMNG